MRPIAVAVVAVLMIAAEGRAGEGTKKATAKKAALKSKSFNPKEITVDKNVPWKKDSQQAKQKVNEPIRILGAWDLSIGTIINVDSKARTVDLMSKRGVVRAEIDLNEFRIVKRTDMASERGTFAELAKLKGVKVLVATKPNTPMHFHVLADDES